uniref:Uncharacterized protein n=1 Tax=Globodera rostochiensis TaxID=31243 RepID=A0A914HBI2_GLORO
MNDFWILILAAFFSINSLDNAESVKVKLEETPLKTFDEIFGEGWWDKGEAADDLKTPAPTNFGQNVHHQIDRQNTQIGQIEPNSTDQLGQIEPNSTDQKDERKQKFDQRKAELQRDGFKNSYKNQINETVAKELGLSFKTISNWKRELGQTKPNKHSHSEQKELMKRYYEIKAKNPKIRDENIAKMLKICRATLCNWKKQFDRQQMHSKAVDGQSVEENAVANVQKIGNSNSGSI